jgi:hypothetical protein
MIKKIICNYSLIAKISENAQFINNALFLYWTKKANVQQVSAWPTTQATAS